MLATSKIEENPPTQMRLARESRTQMSKNTKADEDTEKNSQITEGSKPSQITKIEEVYKKP